MNKEKAIEILKRKTKKTREGLAKNRYYGEQFVLEQECEAIETVLNYIEELEKENKDYKNIVNELLLKKINRVMGIFSKNKSKRIRLSKIKIPDYYVEPRVEKMNFRRRYYLINQKYFAPIIVDKNNNLVDGYTSYLIAKELKKKIVKVEVVDG